MTNNNFPEYENSPFLGLHDGPFGLALIIGYSILHTQRPAALEIQIREYTKKLTKVELQSLLASAAFQIEQNLQEDAARYKRNIEALAREGYRAIQSCAAQRRTGKLSPLYEFIQRAKKEKHISSFDDLLAFIKDDDAVEDWYENLSNPIDVHGFEVLDDLKKIAYTKRTGEAKRVTFKAVKNKFGLL